jgi:hypothetical protein
MGISDEDYAQAQALQREHIKAHVEHLRKTRMAPNDGTLEDAIKSASVLKNAPAGVKVIDEKDLQHEAMKAPLSALVDMWTVRWSGEWVNEGEFVKDDFWRLAFIRLTGANKLEKHSLANQYEAVYRII